MHIPKFFAQTNRDPLLKLIEQYPFATLVVAGEGGSQVNHLPLVLQHRENALVLQGHIAKANPLWQQATDAAQAIAIFNGPNCYVSPSYYPTKHENGRAVPTWNYVVVHVEAVIRFVHDQDWNLAMLQALTAQHEQHRDEPWSISDAPRDYIDRMLPAIVGIELTDLKINGQWKLSQNQPTVNKQGVAEGLSTEADESAQKIAQLVAELIK